MGWGYELPSFLWCCVCQDSPNSPSTVLRPLSSHPPSLPLTRSSSMFTPKYPSEGREWWVGSDGPWRWLKALYPTKVRVWWCFPYLSLFSLYPKFFFTRVFCNVPFLFPFPLNFALRVVIGSVFNKGDNIMRLVSIHSNLETYLFIRFCSSLYTSYSTRYFFFTWIWI